MKGSQTESSLLLLLLLLWRSSAVKAVWHCTQRANDTFVLVLLISTCIESFPRAEMAIHVYNEYIRGIRDTQEVLCVLAARGLYMRIAVTLIGSETCKKSYVL